jgi:hypothetical protein
MYNTTKPHNAIILEQVKRTWDTKYLTVSNGPYPVITRKFALEVREVDHTDGIGTKGEYHWRYRHFLFACTRTAPAMQGQIEY